MLVIEGIRIDEGNRIKISENREQNPKSAKLGQKRSSRGHVNHFLEFWDPLDILGTAQARKFKFGMQIDDLE